ncbi:hypothetical protein QFZ20_002119 [Flavobacterium sp. W4I14]|nr:hypothetical protein [Flavobacterium sp. W4I14]
MTKFPYFFLVLIAFCASGFCQVPTGTIQRSTSDTLIKKTVPATGKYKSGSTKWPKRDSLKSIRARKDASKRKAAKGQKTNIKQEL